MQDLTRLSGRLAALAVIALVAAIAFALFFRDEIPEEEETVSEASSPSDS